VIEILDQLTDEQFHIWLAGFFDGEGCVSMTTGLHGPNVSLTQANQDIIAYIQKRTGLGYVQETRVEEERWRTRYDLRIRNMPEARKFLESIRPYSFIKADAIARAIQAMDDYDNIQLAREQRNQTIIDMAKTQTHQRVADRVGVSRALVSLIVKAGVAHQPTPRKQRKLNQEYKYTVQRQKRKNPPGRIIGRSTTSWVEE